MYKRFPAVISNDLIKSLHSADEKDEVILSVMEYKIIFALFSKIKKTDTQLYEYDIPIKDFCKFWGISYGGNQGKIISESVKLLSEKTYIINNKSVKYLSSDSHVSNSLMHLKLDESICNYVINLVGNFTVFNLDIIAKMKSKFSIRLYMYLKTFESQQFYNIELPEAFEVFGDNIYTTKSQFCNNILKKSVNEIDIKGDITVSYKIEKYFAAPDKIRFFIRSKENQSKEITMKRKKMPYIDICVDDDERVFKPLYDKFEIADENEFPF